MKKEFSKWLIDKTDNIIHKIGCLRACCLKTVSVCRKSFFLLCKSKNLNFIFTKLEIKRHTREVFTTSCDLHEPKKASLISWRRASTIFEQ